MRSCIDVQHMQSRRQRVALLMHDKWSADENIMLRWQLVAKLVDVKMGVYDPQDMGSRCERLGFLVRKKMMMERLTPWMESLISVQIYN